MSEVEKLRVLLPHWMEHNNGHEAECIKWSEIARREGKESVADYLDAAVKAMNEVNVLLEKALDKAGGEAELHHHHHHDHSHE